MKNKFIKLSGLALSLMPAVALAQNTATCDVYRTSGTIQYLICKIAEILNIIIPVLIVLGIVYFVWGVVSFVIGNDEEAKKKGRDRMIYGIIGLVVIVSMWGLVGIVKNTFQLDQSATIVVPGLPQMPE